MKMKTYRMNVDFRGRDKSWSRVFEVEAENEDSALFKMYLELHRTMKCAFRIWSCFEQVENPKLDLNEVF